MPTANIAPRWLRAFACLVLALGVCSAVQPLAAQDGQPAILTYYMDVTPARTSICVGQTVTYHVSIRARVLLPGDILGVANVTYAGASVSGFNPNILSDATRSSSGSAPLHVDLPFTGDFRFTGAAPGRTTIRFDGEVHAQPLNYVVANTFPVQFELPVRVVPCRVKVITVARWAQRLVGGSVNAMVTTYDGEMFGDAEGYLRGSTPHVVWLVRASIPGCAQTNTLRLSTVTMRGRITNEGQIEVDLTFDPLGGSESIGCPLGVGGGAVRVGLSPLHVTVPAYGGTESLPQTLSGPAGDLYGFVTVTIIPIPAP